MHKILSIAMLALSISLIAASTLFLPFVSTTLAIPLFLWMIYIPVIASSILQHSCTPDPLVFPAPLGTEAVYIHKAFKKPYPKPPSVEECQMQFDTNKQILENELACLQQIHQHQDTIRTGINLELLNLNLADDTKKNDFKRLINLQKGANNAGLLADLL